MDEYLNDSVNKLYKLNPPTSAVWSPVFPTGNLYLSSDIWRHSQDHIYYVKLVQLNNKLLQCIPFCSSDHQIIHRCVLLVNKDTNIEQKARFQTALSFLCCHLILPSEVCGEENVLCQGFLNFSVRDLQNNGARDWQPPLHTHRTHALIGVSITTTQQNRTA